MMTTAILLVLAAAPALQDDKTAEDALDTFKAAFKSTSEADRVAAVNDLAKVHHTKTLSRLASLLTTDGPSVRLAAAKASRLCRDEEARGGVARRGHGRECQGNDGPRGPL